MPDLVTDALIASAVMYWQHTFVFPGWDITGWATVIFVLKRRLKDTDREALLLLRLTNPAAAASDGVKALNGLPIDVADALRGKASLAVSAVNPATIVATVQQEAMDILPTPDDLIYWWEIDVWIAGNKRQLGQGEFNLTEAVWRATTPP
jgi:hypothetical protein